MRGRLGCTSIEKRARSVEMLLRYMADHSDHIEWNGSQCLVLAILLQAVRDLPHYPDAKAFFASGRFEAFAEFVGLDSGFIMDRLIEMGLLGRSAMLFEIKNFAISY